MPAAILEAMASGLPVIATDAEGVPDIFDTSLAFGRMVSKGDTAALARAMVDLSDMSQATREKMGQNASLRLKEGFTHTQMAESIVNIYREVIEEHAN
jgi:starch synthase